MFCFLFHAITAKKAKKQSFYLVAVNRKLCQRQNGALIYFASFAPLPAGLIR